MYHRQVSSQPYPGVQYRHAPNPRAQSAAVAPPRTGYTLGHAGRQLRVGPIAFWVVVGTLVIMAGWTIITATYFAFRDDVLTGLIARQAEMQYAYEDRIADLRQQIDRMSSRQLLNQEQYETQARPDHAPAVGAGKPRQRHPGDAGLDRHRLDPADRTRADPFGAEPAVAGQRQVLEPVAARARDRARQRHLEHPRPPASVARSRGSAAGGVAVLDRRQLRGQGAAHPRRPGRTRARRRASPRAKIPAVGGPLVPARYALASRRPARSSITSTASASPVPRSTA